MPGKMTLLLGAPRGGRPTGSALHAAVLAAIDQVEPALAQRMHDGGSPPLYHIALLAAERRDQRVLHLGMADDSDFYRLLSSWMRAPPALHIDGEPLPLARLDAAQGARSWEDLAARAPARVRLHLQSPTLFRAPSLGAGGPRPVRVFPSPERVLDSLSRRWTAFSTSPLETSGLAEWVDEIDMRGGVVDWSGAHPIKGFVGSVSWALNGRRREIGALLGLGEHLGVGSRTAQGCGHLELEVL